MKQYLDLLELVMKNGDYHENRIKVNAISYFGTQTRYDLKKGFPLLTTKKMAYKSIFLELLWFLKGDTNIKFLIDNNVRIWNEWPYEKFMKSKDFNGENINEFIERLKKDDYFCKEYENLGPVYGKQWRNLNGVDQKKYSKWYKK